MKKTIFPILFTFLTLTVGLLTACGSSQAGQSGSQATPVAESATDTAGGEEAAAPEHAITKDILIDPANAANEDSLLIVNYLYEGLVKLDANGLVPALAEAWEVSDDGLDYIFTLRQGVQFHDGAPFNADAVIANFNRWFDKNNAAHGTGEYAAWQSIFGGFKGETNADGSPKSIFDGAEKVDEYTVLIHLTKPDPNFVAKLVNPAFFMVSPSAFSADYFGTSLGTAAGTGPYKLANWSDSSLTLEPFAAYWGEIPSAAVELPFK